MPPIPAYVLFGPGYGDIIANKVRRINALRQLIPDVGARRAALYELLYYMEFTAFEAFERIFRDELSAEDRIKLIDNRGRVNSVDLANYTFSYLYRTFTPKMAAAAAMPRAVAELLPTAGYNPAALGYNIEEIRKQYPLPPMEGGKRKTRNRKARKRSRKNRK
jgi:hypothetical protein